MLKLLQEEKRVQEELDRLKEIKKNFNGRFIHDEIISASILTKILAENRKGINYLELGVHNGASFSTAISSTSGVKCCGVDLFEDTHDPKHKNHDKINIERTRSNIESNNPFDNDFTLIAGNLRDPSVPNQVRDFFSEEVDILFIDADHDYDSVKKDFTEYLPLVKQGGYILLDDYAEHMKGVIQFVDDVDESLVEKNW